MDLDDARDVIREQPRAVPATLRADGTPQMSPVLAAVADDGDVLVSTRETELKVANLRRGMYRERRVLPQVALDRAGPDRSG